MPTVEQITEFVKKIFERYRVLDTEFFTTYDDDENCMVDCPLFPYGKIDDDTLERLSVHLGLTKQEILNMDESASLRYWNKYPFFRLSWNYLESWNWYAHCKGEYPTAEDFLINAIFTENEGYPAKRRYQYQDVKKRLISKLKELDAFMPGTFHKGAEITDLSIQTEVIFSFPKCAEMVRSYIDMVNRTKELFFKAVHSDLNIEEINELNFLASWLRASDAVMPSVNITYPNICIYRSAYLEENLDDFYSYVKLRRYTYETVTNKEDSYGLYSYALTGRYSNYLSSMDFVPWRCKEFFDYPDLVQEIVNISPAAKSSMREFAMLVANFSCWFAWSDADPIVFSDEEEQMMHDFNESIGEEDVPLERRAKEHTHIYVEKNKAELEDWEEYTKRIIKAASPAAQGGVVLPKRDYELLGGANAVMRTMKRIDAKHNRR